MVYNSQSRPVHSRTESSDFDYPEPTYPYLYASSVGHTTPAVSSAPLPPPSVAHSRKSSTFVSSRGGQGGRVFPERTYSDTSRTSTDSYIAPSASISQVGSRSKASYGVKHHRKAKSFVSREDPEYIPPRQSTGYTDTLREPVILTAPPKSPAVFTAGSSRATQLTGRIRGVLKKNRPNDSSSYTSSSSSSVPDVIPDTRLMASPYPAPHSAIESSLVESRLIPVDRQSLAESSAVQKTRFRSTVQPSRHLSKVWDARSPPRLDAAARALPAFDTHGIHHVNLIVRGLPWSVHVSAGSSVKPRSQSQSRTRTRAEQITVGDVVDCVYASLNKSLTRTDVRAASDHTKKKIAHAAAAAEAESERGEHSARTGKPSAARRIDFLGPRVWFKGLERDDAFAREQGYGSTEKELKNVWVMRFSDHPHTSRLKAH